ncbi:Mitogen-activated protein kinase kinase kinase [Actinidia chinensis var. chinensis]|uniref:Mitogen-activated protein kinase kinase kinase n=1 Tax=Actinidia chinensis var. chinensis TaxID=1590841 RepID=A0A2R6PQI1_ACTCC|nr:Mitogen-activated protein kinase kinase kinase [Actinidia chinensis var. chinensis]
MERVKRPNWVRGSCVGRGSFGTVSVAVNKSDGQVFAVKSVNRGMGSESQIEALENEIRILRSASSPWVVKYLGDDETVEDGAASFRNLHLEYMPGGTVADVMKKSGADVDESLVRSYSWCVVSALRYVHAKGIVHCDVKGKNVLLASTAGAAKLADFGSATEISDVTPSKPCGSPLWMAPEVVRGEYQGPESDVWSLGCTVIEMVTGRPPWEDRGGDTLCRIGYSEESPEIPTQFSELGRDFVNKCLHRDQTERWSCDQLLRHPFIASSSPPDSISYSSPRCVLDSLTSEFCDEDEEIEEDESSLAWELRTQSMRQRIGKLASDPVVIWESDGWVMVRDFVSEEEGTVSEYPNSIRTEEQIEETRPEYSSSVDIERAFLECSDSGGGVSAERKEFGCGWWDWAVESTGEEDFTTGEDFLFLNLLYFTAVICNLLWFINCNKLHFNSERSLSM